MLAISVRKGRAIPVWCQANQSEGALIVPLLAALKVLFAALSTTAPELNLVLVMDRWFASDRLFTMLTEHGVYFIARTKSDKLVQLPWDPSWWREPIGDISHEELPVTHRTHHLRLIRSAYKNGMTGDEPWFLPTNMPEPSEKGKTDGVTRRQILKRYSERFEVEESFKNLKWLNRLEWQRVKKPEVIRSLLLFTFLGWWLVWCCLARDHSQPKHIHPKKRLSWFRTAWEELQRLLRTPLLPPLPVAQRGREK